MTMASTATSPLPSAPRQRGWSDGECDARLRRPPHVRRRRQRLTLFTMPGGSYSGRGRTTSRLAPPPSLAALALVSLLLLLLPSFIRASDAPFYKGERHIPTYSLRRAQTECLYTPFTATESATLSVFVPSVVNGEAELTCAATFEGPISTLEQTMNASAAQRLGSSLMEGMKKHWPNVQRSVAEPVKKGSPAKLIKFDEVVDFEHVHDEEEEDEEEDGSEDEDEEEESSDAEAGHGKKRAEEQAAQQEKEQGRRNHHRNRRNQGRERRMDERKKRREEKFRRRQEERQKQKQREREGKDGGDEEERMMQEAVKRSQEKDRRKQKAEEQKAEEQMKDGQEEQKKADNEDAKEHHTEHTSDIMKRRRERIEQNKKEAERKAKELKKEREVNENGEENRPLEEQKTEEGATDVEEDEATRKTRERIKRNQEKLARAQQQAGGRRLTEEQHDEAADADGEEEAMDGEHRRLQFVPGRGGGRGGQLTGGRFGKRPRDFAKDEDEELYEGEAFERTFTIPVDGWYRFCVRPTPGLPPQAQLIVEMDLRSSSKLGGVDPDTGHVYTHERRLELNEEADLELLLDEAAELNGIQEEDLESTTELIMEMNDLVSEIRDEQTNHKHRLQHHRTLDAHSKSKLAKTAAMETALYVLITAYQVRTVRNWFKGGQLLG